MRRLQDITMEKVLSNLGGTSFLTESGKVVEGNYAVGEYAPVVFDKSSRRYLPAWRRERAGGEEPFKRIDDEAPGVIIFYEGNGVMATFHGGESKIYFEVANPLSGGDNNNFYIDLAPVFLAKGHTADNIPYALKIIEYAPNMGVLVYFRAETYLNIELAYVLRFEVTTELTDTVIYNGKIYKKRSFGYAYDEFNIRESAVTPLVPVPQCSADLPERPYGVADIWYDMPVPPYTQVQAVGTALPLGGYEIYGGWGFYWIGILTADRTEYTGLYRHIKWGGQLDYQKFIVPIGVAVWLKKVNGELNDIDWSIHFSCLGDFKFFVKNDWAVKTEWGSSSGSYVSLWSTFQVPFIIFAKRDESLGFQDPQNLFSVPWCVDGNISGPICGDYEFGPLNTHDEQQQGAPPGVNHWDPKVTTYPITWSPGSEWQGSYRHVYPLFNLNGTLNKYLLRHTKIGHTQPWWTIPDYDKPYEVIYLNEHRVGSFYYFVDFYRTLGVWPPVYPRSELFGGVDFAWLDYLRPWGYPYRHQGGGTNNRFMVRIAPNGDCVGEKTNRNVYVVKGILYDHGTPIPNPLNVYGKVSRELLIAKSILSTISTAILDSTIDNYGNATLVGKYPNYEDLTSSDQAFQPAPHTGILADFGMINKDFFG